MSAELAPQAALRELLAELDETRARVVELLERIAELEKPEAPDEPA